MALSGSGMTGVPNAITNAAVNLGVHINVNHTQLNSAFAQINRQLSGLTNQFHGFQQRVTALAPGMRTFGTHLHNIGQRAGIVNSEFRHLDRFLGYFAAGTLIATAVGFARMATELQAVQLRLAVFTRDITAVPREFDKLIQASSSSSFSLNTMADALVRLKAAGLEPIVDDQGNGLLKNLADGIAAFGGDDNLFYRATVAIQQMAGKGVISMEELRQQLGEAIPSAVRLMAEGLDMSVAEFVSKVAKAEIGAEEGIEAFSRKLEEKFGGAGELLLGTVDGQLSLFKKNLQLLSKTLFLDTGAFDVITAALQDINAHFRGWIDYLKTSGGQEILDEIGHKIEQLALFAAEASGPLLNLVDVIGTVFGTIISISGALPAELVGGGLLGLLIWGRGGLIRGAALGAFSDELAGIARLIAGFFDDIVTLITSVFGDDAIKYGLLGWLVFRGKGLLVGLAVGVIKDIYDWIESINESFIRFTAKIRTYANPINWFTGEDSLADQAKKAGDEAYSAFVSEREAMRRKIEGYRTGKKPEDVDSGGSASTKARDVVEGLIGKWKLLAVQVESSRKELVSGFEAMHDVGGLTDEQTDRLIEMEKRLGTMNDEIGANGDAKMKRINEMRRFLASVDADLDQARATLAGLPEGDSRIPKLTREITDFAAKRDKFASAVDQIERLGNAVKSNKLDQNFESFKNQIERFLDRDVPGMETYSQKIARVKDEYVKVRETLDQIENRITHSNLAQEEKLTLLALVNDAEQKNVDIQTAKLAIEERAEKVRKLTLDRQYADQLKGFGQGVDTFNSDFMGAEAEKAKAWADANQRVADSLQDISRAIEDVKLDPDITEEERQRQVASLQTMYEEMSVAGEAWLERFKQQQSDAWGFMQQIGTQVSSTLSKALADVALGTGDLQAAMTQLWATAVQAAAEYIVKLIIIKALESASGVAGGGSMAALFGFAQGGVIPGGIKTFGQGGVVNGPTMFGVMGEQGSEAILPLTRMRDGTMGVSAQGGGGGGGTTVVNISAIDAKGVHQLFMEHGRSLVASMGQRRLLNRMDR